MDYDVRTATHFMDSDVRTTTHFMDYDVHTATHFMDYDVRTATHFARIKFISSNLIEANEKCSASVVCVYSYVLHMYSSLLTYTHV
jgi:hypothetical protein